MDAHPSSEHTQSPFPSAADFEALRPKLTALAAKHLNPVLSRRLSAEDVVQETFASALMREDFFAHEPDVPLYFKLRTILFQTMVDLERRHLAAQKRDAYKEVDVPGREADDTSDGGLDWDMFAGTVTAPNSVLAREDRHALLYQAIGELSENDRIVVGRARKVQRFLSQPFHVATQFTGMEGKYVPVSETIRGFKEILAGQHDDIPEGFFLNAGSIDDVVERANAKK